MEGSFFYAADFQNSFISNEREISAGKAAKIIDLLCAACGNFSFVRNEKRIFKLEFSPETSG
ncbi:hypothetical protein C4F50_17115 [Flavobacterium sp. KB82]|uniref:Uncharacterized protein n=1 Tax=Flavobacterium hungaricum TaxID=2082725 RepID=A0ABR9TMQ5_9FLAO|nr:hypothetical protein [Flavobacterium hungaricum]